MDCTFVSTLRHDIGRERILALWLLCRRIVGGGGGGGGLQIIVLGYISQQLQGQSPFSFDIGGQEGLQQCRRVAFWGVAVLSMIVSIIVML